MQGGVPTYTYCWNSISQLCYLLFYFVFTGRPEGDFQAGESYPGIGKPGPVFFQAAKKGTYSNLGWRPGNQCVVALTRQILPGPVHFTGSKQERGGDLTLRYSVYA